LDFEPLCIHFGSSSMHEESEMSAKAPVDAAALEMVVPAKLEVGDPEPSSVGERPACFKSTAHEILVIAVLTCGTGLYAITSGSAQSITDTIGRDLNMSQAEISWIVNAQNLAAGSWGFQVKYIEIPSGFNQISALNGRAERHPGKKACPRGLIHRLCDFHSDLGICDKWHLVSFCLDDRLHSLTAL
jgi:hypothetical protein